MFATEMKRDWAVDPTGAFLVTPDASGLVRMRPFAGGPPQLLPGHDAMVYDVAVSPDGKWIASAGEDETLRLWPTPEGVPFHTLPRAQLLDRLRALTNLRVVPAEGSPTGYRLEAEAFPGWENVPTW